MILHPEGTELADRDAHASTGGRSGTRTPRIAGIASALPRYCASQGAVTRALESVWGGRVKPGLLERLHSRTGVRSRYFGFPLRHYPEFASWRETNAAWLEIGEEIGAAALEGALRTAGIPNDALDALFVVSITGIASPSLDARLINRLRLRPDIKRTPIFGVGCVGGALGLTRAADYALAYPQHTAAVLAVEICSLTFQREDLSTANMIATGLFGDGAVAVIVEGEQGVGGSRATRSGSADRRKPAILDCRSVFYPDSEDIMGWDISENGFRIVLSPQLPELIRNNLARDVDSFLDKHGLGRSDIGSWVIHTGGPKILEAVQQTLDLRDTDLARSWACLRDFGNLSSASVLLVLEDFITNDPPEPGTLGLLLAMGPGFCAELILLRW
jgi:alkylresorcinol/alkylpyrone synthase